MPEPGALALERYRSGNVLWVADTALGFLLPGLILFTGASAGLRSLAQRVTRSWLGTVVLYTVLLVVLLYLLALPLAFYREFIREHAYGLSNQTLAKWVGDAGKELAVTCVAAALVVWVPYLLLRRSPRRWWLYAGLAALPLLILIHLVAPVYVDPLFNRFRPMRDTVLESRILALAERAGIEGSRVYQVEKSVDTKTVNAYVTGLGGTKRIVLYDTLLERLDPDEVLFVVGHEIGHYVLGHVRRFVLAAWLLIVLSLYLIHRVAGALIARHRLRFGFDHPADVASLPLLLLLAGAAGLAASPALLALSRRAEREADRFGLELTRENHAAATAFVKLAALNLEVPRPGPIYTLFRASHPSLAERIEFANRYRPWAIGAPLRYGDRFDGDRLHGDRRHGDRFAPR